WVLPANIPACRIMRLAHICVNALDSDDGTKSAKGGYAKVSKSSKHLNNST
ncbi:hypothetical protein V5O48_017761, partial [Marasmius crinis-equi]